MEKFYKRKKKIGSSDELKRQLLEWSFCSKEWATCEVREMKKGWKKVYELILERNLECVKNGIVSLELTSLSPLKMKNSFLLLLIIENGIDCKHDDVF